MSSYCCEIAWGLRIAVGLVGLRNDFGMFVWCFGRVLEVSEGR